MDFPFQLWYLKKFLYFFINTTLIFWFKIRTFTFLSLVMLLIIVKQNNKIGGKSSLQIKQKRDIPNATKLFT